MTEKAKAKAEIVTLINRRCVNFDIDSNLRHLSLDSISDAVFLGLGGNGLVLQLRGSKLRDKFAIKIQIKNKNICNDYTREVKYTNLSNKLGTGVRVYDFFYYEDSKDAILPALQVALDKIPQETKDNDEKNYIPSILDTSTDLYVQFIVMEAYETDCHTFLEKNSHTKSFVAGAKVISSICDLIDRQIKGGLYCFDIKLPNFVMNVLGTDQLVDVKMIDYGQGFCTDKSIHTYAYVSNPTMEFYNETPNLTYIDMLSITLIIQIFIQCITNIKGPKQWLYKGLRTCERLKLFLRTDSWEQNIRKYTLDACNSVFSDFGVNGSEQIYNSEYMYLFFVSQTVDDFLVSPTKQKQRQIVDNVIKELTVLKNYCEIGVLPPEYLAYEPRHEFKYKHKRTDDDEYYTMYDVGMGVGVGLLGLVSLVKGLSLYDETVSESRSKHRKSRRNK